MSMFRKNLADIKPDFRRVQRALHHEEPDRVPFVEGAVDYKIMSRFIGRPVTDDDLASQVEFWVGAGYDYILINSGMMRPGKVTKGSQISKVIQGVLQRDTTDEKDDRTLTLEDHSLIHTEKDFEAFPWVEAARLDYCRFHDVQAYLPDGMKIIATSGKIFTLTWMLMGYEDFNVNLKLNPGLVSRVIENVAAIQLSDIRQLAEIPNLAVVWAVDDLAFHTGPMISPNDLRKYFFPWYEEFGKICRDNNLYFFFHSDGVLWDLMEDLIALGVDALHPIDPTCMDIEEVKEKIGDRVCIIGNISNEILAIGTPDEVTELTKKRLKVLAPGGGYCLGSGNSIPDWAKIENYRAMLEAGIKYGYYPIDIQ